MSTSPDGICSRIAIISFIRFEVDLGDIQILL
jgi:hypothetical protein